jgi:hypothetical protein
MQLSMRRTDQGLISDSIKTTFNMRLALGRSTDMDLAKKRNGEAVQREMSVDSESPRRHLGPPTFPRARGVFLKGQRA